MEISHTIVVSFLTVIPALIYAFVDAMLINNNIPLNKAYHAIKFWALVLIGVLLYFLKAFENPLELLAAMAAYWISFDILLNAFRGKSIFYVPKNPDSWLERKLGKDKHRYFAYKILLWIVFTIMAAVWSSLLGFENVTFNF